MRLELIVFYLSYEETGGFSRWNNLSKVRELTYSSWFKYSLVLCKRSYYEPVHLPLWPQLYLQAGSIMLSGKDSVDTLCVAIPSVQVGIMRAVVSVMIVVKDRRHAGWEDTFRVLRYYVKSGDMSWCLPLKEEGLYHLVLCFCVCPHTLFLERSGMYLIILIFIASSRLMSAK